jgi:hypothetical protein
MSVHIYDIYKSFILQYDFCNSILYNRIDIIDIINYNVIRYN